MAYSRQDAVSDGTLQVLDVSIQYMRRADVFVLLDDVLTTDWGWVGVLNSIAFPAPLAAGVKVTVVRRTRQDKVIHEFAKGALFNSTTMDTDFRQMLYLAQEYTEGGGFTDLFSDLNMHGFRLTNLGAGVAPSDAATMAQLNALASGTAEGLRNDLAAPTGSGLVGHGAATVQEQLDGARAVSYYGSTQAALMQLMEYARTTGKPIKLDRNVTMETTQVYDMQGVKLTLDFNGYAILSDSAAFGIDRPGVGSLIHQPDMQVISDPWCITRWDANGNWLSEGAILGTLTRTKAPGYYQPTANDGSVWASLTTEQQNQNISARLYVSRANGLEVSSPRGLFCLYEFDECQRTEVTNAQILCGGKGVFGTINFKNLQTSGYGVGNYVIGGYVHYGSYNAVSFMRNKHGGVSTLSVYRSGESGIKLFQNEVGGRSARCYNMKMTDIECHQTVYDGHDYNSDFGPITERVDDYSLAQYPWQQLPTCHQFSNLKAHDCYGVGMWGDGQFNAVSDVRAQNCKKAGIYFRMTNSEIDDPFVMDCNLNGGQHQIIVEGGNTRINSPRVHASASVPDGFAIYTTDPTTVVNDERCTGVRTDLQVRRADRSSNNLTMGNDDITQTTVSLFGRPRGKLVNRAAGELRFVLTGGTPGNEEGLIAAFATSGGVTLPKGFIAMPNEGGHAQLGAQGSYNGAVLNPGHAAFYENGAALRVAYKKMDGTILTFGLTA